MFALAGRQHEEPHSLRKQPAASAGDVRPSSPPKNAAGSPGRARYLPAGGGGDGQAVGQQPRRLVLFDELDGDHRDDDLEGKTQGEGI